MSKKSSLKDYISLGSTLLALSACDRTDQAQNTQNFLTSDAKIREINDFVFDEADSILSNMRSCAQGFKNISPQEQGENVIYKINCSEEVAADALSYLYIGSDSPNASQFAAVENRDLNDQYDNHYLKRSLVINGDELTLSITEVMENEGAEQPAQTDDGEEEYKITLNQDGLCEIESNGDKTITTDVQAYYCEKNIDRIRNWMKKIFTDIQKIRQVE